MFINQVVCIQYYGCLSGKIGMPRELENLLPNTKQLTAMQEWVDKTEQVGVKSASVTG